MTHFRKTTFVLLLAGILFSFPACKNSLVDMEKNMLNRAVDQTLPVLILDSPAGDAIYDQTITVSGSISDDGGKMPSLTYMLQDALGVETLEGTVEINKTEGDATVNGTFSFELSTVQFDTDITLALTATDWNGNSFKSDPIKLTYPGSTLPSLKLIPGNKELTLKWDPIPGVETYTVYYNVQGNSFAESIADAVNIKAADFDPATGLTLNSSEHGVQNSALCQVRVTASDSEDNTWSSSLLESVPLSEFSLIPKTEAYENQIYLSWKPIKVPPQKTVTYQVWRSTTGEDGSYILISDDFLTEPNYMDSSVVAGVNYLYKISVSENENTFCTPVAAQCSQMYTEMSAEIYRFLTDENIIDIEISGNRAYAVRLVQDSDPSSSYNVNAELIALDITDISNMTVLSRALGNLEDIKKEESSVAIYDLAVSNERAYVAVNYTNPASNSRNCVLSFDISNPLNIVHKEAEVIDLVADYVKALAVDKNRDILYLGLNNTSSQAYLGAVDISDPATFPGLKVSTAFSGSPADIAFIENYAYFITQSPALLTLFDCSNLSSITIVDINGIPAGNQVDLDANGGNVNDKCLDVTALDIDSASNTLVISSMVNDGIIDSDYYHGGVWVYDITSRTAPAYKGVVDIGQPLKDITIRGDFAYCSTDTGKVLILGIDDPYNIFKRVEFNTIGGSTGLEANKSGIIVADGSAGLTTITFQEPEAMTIADTKSPNQSYGSFLKGNILYLAQRYGISSYTVGSNGSLTKLNYQAVPAEDVIVVGDYAFYATGSNTSGEIAVVHLSTNGDVSSTPRYYNGYDNSSCIDNWGEFLYIAEQNAGVEIFDMSDPENLVSLGVIPAERSVEKIIARDDYLYIADDTYALTCYNITDPLNPQFIGEFFNRQSEERSISNLSATKDHILVTDQHATFILEARPEYNWTEADASRTELLIGNVSQSKLGSAVSYIFITNSGLLAEGDHAYFTKDKRLRIYSIANLLQPQNIYMSPSDFLSNNPQTIELSGNFIIAHEHNQTYSIQIQ